MHGHAQVLGRDNARRFTHHRDDFAGGTVGDGVKFRALDLVDVDAGFAIDVNVDAGAGVGGIEDDRAGGSANNVRANSVGKNMADFGRRGVLAGVGFDIDRGGGFDADDGAATAAADAVS